jgi:hypothetical protein
MLTHERQWIKSFEGIAQISGLHGVISRRDPNDFSFQDCFLANNGNDVTHAPFWLPKSLHSQGSL